MANGTTDPQGVPFGWRGLSNRIPRALARSMFTHSLPETAGKGRYDFTRGPVTRGDVNTLTLSIVPRLKRLARGPKRPIQGDIVEVRNDGRSTR